MTYAITRGTIADCSPLVNTRAEKRFLTAGEAFVYGTREAADYAIGIEDEVNAEGTNFEVNEGWTRDELKESGDSSEVVGRDDDAEKSDGMDAMMEVYLKGGARKNYKFFDAPFTRNASSIIADLIDNAVALDEEIRFERTKAYDCYYGSNSFLTIGTTELNAKGEKVASGNCFTMFWNGDAYSINRAVWNESKRYIGKKKTNYTGKGKMFERADGSFSWDEENDTTVFIVNDEDKMFSKYDAEYKSAEGTEEN